MTVKNHGPDAADQVKITDLLPGSVNFVSASTDCSQSGQTVICNVTSLAQNAEKSFAITVIPTVAGGFSNSATAKQSDPNPTNNTASVVTTAVTKTADVSISQKSSTTSINLGEKLTYTLTVVNNGPDAITGAQIVDNLNGATLDAAPANCSKSDGKVVCNVGALAKGAKASVALSLRPTAQGVYSHSASVTGNATDTNAANNTAVVSVTVNPPVVVDVALNIKAPVTVKKNAKVTYKLTVKNNSKFTATGVTSRISWSWSGNADLYVLSPPKGCSNDGVHVVCKLGTLKSNTTKAVTITIKLSVADTLDAFGDVSVNELDSNTASNSALATVTVK